MYTDWGALARESREMGLARSFEIFRAGGGRVQDWVKRNKLPEIAGSNSFPSIANHPLGPPTVSGTTITVDVMLQQPTRIVRFLQDITLQRFLLDLIYVNAGGVTGGAVIFDMATVNELYLDRDVQRVEAGAEFPIVTSSRRMPFTAIVEKWGAKTYIEDEARDRNNTWMLTNQLRQLGNTMVRKLNQRAIDTLEAAITANGGASNMVGKNWNAVVTGGSAQSNATLWPAADLAAAQLSADTDELGIVFDLWIMNPAQMAQLALVYGAQLGNVLASYNIKTYSSNRVTAGIAYVLQTGMVGELRIEKPWSAETWREPETERTWIQCSVRPVMYVTNPFAVRKVTGLAG